MDGSLESLFNFYVFTTGRRQFAHRQVQRLAADQGFTELEEHCKAAVAHDTALLEMERRWAGEPATADAGANPAARRLDVLVDRTLGAIRDTAAAQAEGAPSEDPIHAEVEAFTKRLFPLGVHAVTSLPYVDELAAVDAIVRLLKTELAPALKSLGVGLLTKRLADLAGQYREALEAPPPSLLSWGKVRAARADGQGLLLETVSIILGRHHGRTAEATAERLALLAPILRQNDAIGAYLRTRRKVEDVDPETGNENPDAPGSKDVPQGGGDDGG